MDFADPSGSDDPDVENACAHGIPRFVRIREAEQQQSWTGCLRDWQPQSSACSSALPGPEGNKVKKTRSETRYHCADVRVKLLQIAPQVLPIRDTLVWWKSNVKRQETREGRSPEGRRVVLEVQIRHSH
jgi:hypothetical protein